MRKTLSTRIMKWILSVLLVRETCPFSLWFCCYCLSYPASELAKSIRGRKVDKVASKKYRQSREDVKERGRKSQRMIMSVTLASRRTRDRPATRGQCTINRYLLAELIDSSLASRHVGAVLRTGVRLRVTATFHISSSHIQRDCLPVWEVTSLQHSSTREPRFF